jgi:Glycosyl transferase family 2
MLYRSGRRHDRILCRNPNRPQQTRLAYSKSQRLTGHVKRNVEQFCRAFEPGPVPWQRRKTEATVRLPVPAQALEDIEPADDRFTGNMESGFVPLGDAAAKPNFGFCSLTIVHPLLTDLCQRFRSAFHTTYLTTHGPQDTWKLRELKSAKRRPARGLGHTQGSGCRLRASVGEEASFCDTATAGIFGRTKSGPSAPNRSRAMKIFSICCVRDENDIVGETLEAALSWSDRIFVFDNASADGTWETVQEIARKNSRIEIVGHDDRTFTDELRGEIFESCRSVAAAGDWWCRLDSDEIYIDDPHRFLANVPDKYGFVYSASFDFYFTDVDLRSYEKDPSKWLAQPVRERLKFYQNNWGEPRFVRHRNDLHWAGLVWPANRGRIFPSRIRLKHFPYRSPAQMVPSRSWLELRLA